MKLKITIIIAVCLLNINLFAQTDTIKIQEVEIKASRQAITYFQKTRNVTVIDKKEVKEIKANSIIDILEYVGSIDVRQRGAAGVQADISIRAGSFEQTLVLLNGAKISDPQTGHHNMNIPVDINDIERIEILHGAGARIYGANAYSGAINIITKTEKKRNGNLSFSYGEYNLINRNLSLNYNFGNLKNFISASKNTCDGYIENTDFDINNIFYQSSLDLKNTKIDVQAGYNQKKFGANSFYSLAFPDEFEATKTTFVNARMVTGNKVKFKSGVYFRRHKDRFELFRNSTNPASSSIYNNYHLTDIFGADATLNFSSELGYTVLGADFKADKIFSNSLGKLMNNAIDVIGEDSAKYTKSDHRKNINLFLDHKIQIKNTIISGGLMMAWNSDYGLLFYPGIDFSYSLSENVRIFSSANKSLRLPSYTELYINAGGNVGNPDIKPENATNFEIGTKLDSKSFKNKITIFETLGRNTIDWVLDTETNNYHAQNITEINTLGVELDGKILFKKIISDKFPINYFKYGYTYLLQNKQETEFESKYALDYLKHKIYAGLDTRIYKNLSLNVNATFQKREGAYTDINFIAIEYSSVILLNSSINYKSKYFNIFIECSNILNKNYSDMGGIIMPGRWFKIGISTTFPFNKN